MRSNTKSQSALEFLTTYGWAFLVILIMIAALSYFGVLDPSRFLPDKCQASSGIGCIDQFASHTDNFVFVDVINNFGKSITVHGMNATIVGAPDCQPLEVIGVSLNAGALYTQFDDAETAVAGNSWDWQANQQARIAIACAGGNVLNPSERPTVSIDISYREGGSDYVREAEISFSTSTDSGSGF